MSDIITTKNPNQEENHTDALVHNELLEAASGLSEIRTQLLEMSLPFEDRLIALNVFETLVELTVRCPKDMKALDRRIEMLKDRLIPLFEEIMSSQEKQG